MKTSAEWWNETKNDPVKLLDWLFDQYRGEATAAGRIERLRDLFGGEDRVACRLLTTIAAQERTHASWVGALLTSRGETPAVRYEDERYWREPLAAISDLATGCAVGAHAEGMRLERIAVIAADASAPPDIRAVFQRILPQERFHERAFRVLAGPAAMEATRGAHQLGRRVLGLQA